jgi:hypothetical protein
MTSMQTITVAFGGHRGRVPGHDEVGDGSYTQLLNIVAQIPVWKTLPASRNFLRISDNRLMKGIYSIHRA